VTNDDITRLLLECLARVKPELPVASLGADDRFDAVGLTSLEILTVVFEIEEHFGVSLVEAGLDSFRTIREAVDVLDRLVGERA
jgi:acyl carrier protein